MAAKPKPDDKNPVSEQSPEQKDLQVPETLQPPATPADQLSGPTGGESGTLTPEPEPEAKPGKEQYLITSRSDVLHNGDLYTEGEPLWLDQDEAYPLLRNGCIKPKDGAR
ncbi:hypothetical protein [Pseudomonas mosselii]|uniref:Uncharacterized protein n=1 Tax=Pseudomonas mosselii TaxID=78327 RepID=A0ABX9AZH6_9PSED|nr:hypothetical protein [Pseudomonas mosselii]QZP26216.1 hypothetical protein K5H97_26090 [Pseudomonas mosselii]